AGRGTPSLRSGRCAGARAAPPLLIETGRTFFSFGSHPPASTAAESSEEEIDMRFTLTCLTRLVPYALIASFSSLLPALTSAADFPNKVIKMVVPFPPGGTNDILARLFSSKLGELRGWNMVVDNKAGAGSAIGAAFVANSAPDGYTLLSISSSYS